MTSPNRKTIPGKNFTDLPFIPLSPIASATSLEIFCEPEVEDFLQRGEFVQRSMRRKHKLIGQRSVEERTDETEQCVGDKFREEEIAKNLITLDGFTTVKDISTPSSLLSPCSEFLQKENVENATFKQISLEVSTLPSPFASLLDSVKIVSHLPEEHSFVKSSPSASPVAKVSKKVSFFTESSCQTLPAKVINFLAQLDFQVIEPKIVMQNYTDLNSLDLSVETFSADECVNKPWTKAGQKEYILRKKVANQKKKIIQEPDHSSNAFARVRGLLTKSNK